MKDTILVKETLSQLLKAMGISVKMIVVEETEFGILRAAIETENAPLLIGYRGDNLSALQTILRSVLWKKGMERNLSVILDVENYKLEREKRFLSLAEEKAEAVRATGMPQMMPVLPPYMRRIVHLHLAKESFGDLETESVGEEGRRRIQIRKRGTQVSPELTLEGSDI